MILFPFFILCIHILHIPYFSEKNNAHSSHHALPSNHALSGNHSNFSFQTDESAQLQSLSGFDISSQVYLDMQGKSCNRLLYLLFAKRGRHKKNYFIGDIKGDMSPYLWHPPPTLILLMDKESKKKICLIFKCILFEQRMGDMSNKKSSFLRLP